MHFTALLSLYAKEHPDHLRQSLASLAAQTQPAAEILIVLDGAITPALEAVLAEFVGRLPLNIIRLPKNVGLGRALNHGVQHARHEWIFRMDTDDIAAPTRFADQCAYLAAHPQTALLGGQIAEFANTPGQSHASRQVPQTQPEIPFQAETFAKPAICGASVARRCCQPIKPCWITIWQRAVAAPF